MFIETPFSEERSVCGGTGDYKEYRASPAKYVIFPRTTAKSQRFMMFPGTEEDEIEPPAFEYPHVPSARSIVREHIEMLQRGERKPPARWRGRAGAAEMRPEVLDSHHCRGAKRSGAMRIPLSAGRRHATYSLSSCWTISGAAMASVTRR